MRSKRYRVIIVCLLLVASLLDVKYKGKMYQSLPASLKSMIDKRIHS